jgi:hypothetical protein
MSPSPAEIFSTAIESAKDDSVNLPDLISRIIDVAKMFKGTVTAEQLLAILKPIWDSTVVAYDWPRIPNFLEERLEQAAWQVITSGVNALLG